MHTPPARRWYAALNGDCRVIYEKRAMSSELLPLFSRHPTTTSSIRPEHSHRFESRRSRLCHNGAVSRHRLCFLYITIVAIPHVKTVTPIDAIAGNPHPSNSLSSSNAITLTALLWRGSVFLYRPDNSQIRSSLQRYKQEEKYCQSRGARTISSGLIIPRNHPIHSAP